MDVLVQIFASSSPEKERLSSLSKLTAGARPWLCGPATSIADLLLWSLLKKHGLQGDKDPGLKKWHQQFTTNDMLKKYLP
jgi:glutathione S-transferase